MWLHTGAQLSRKHPNRSSLGGPPVVLGFAAVVLKPPIPVTVVLGLAAVVTTELVPPPVVLGPIALPVVLGPAEPAVPPAPAGASTWFPLQAAKYWSDHAPHSSSKPTRARFEEVMGRLLATAMPWRHQRAGMDGPPWKTGDARAEPAASAWAKLGPFVPACAGCRPAQQYRRWQHLDVSCWRR